MMKKTAIYQPKRAGAPRWYNKWFQSPPWLMGFGAVVGLCLLAYVVNVLVGRVHPGSAWGIGYGIAAVVVGAGVFAYAARRRTIPKRLGRTWFYLQFHVYGGVVFLLLVFMHVGFRVPQGILTWWLWLVSIWVVGTGLFGVVLQKWIPTILNSGLSVELNYDRIPEIVDALRERAEALVESGDYQLRTFYRKNLATAMAGPQTRLIYFFDITGGLQARTEQFGYVRGLLPPEEEPTLDALQALFRTKLEADAHYTLQRALRTWLYLHVPFAVVLVVLLVLHLYAVLFY